jgi:hypothetical protein
MVDIAKEALALSGLTLNYELLNWARSKREVMAGNIDGIIGMSLDEESQSQVCFYKRTGDNWQFNTIKDLTNKKFG